MTAEEKLCNIVNVKGTKSTMNTAIAQHLNVAESAIIEVQEWARVLWVRVKGLGARFVSEKVVMNYDYLGESESPMITKFHVWTGPCKHDGFLREHFGKVKILFKECQCTKEELDSFAIPVWSADEKAVALQISGPVAQKARFAKAQGASFIADSFNADLSHKVGNV